MPDKPRISEYTRLHPDAHALRLFRHADDPRSSNEPYAVLDVLSQADDIVQDYTVPTAAAFRTLKRRLGTRVDREAETVEFA